MNDQAPGLHPDWIVPQWPAPAGVRAVLTTCAGGVSQGIFASMNLGDHVGDEPQAVATNRAHLARAIGARPVFMRQVHGRRVAQLDEQSQDGLEADGAVSTRRGPACTVMVADCLPILLAHEHVPAVAALHAGWRGLAGQGEQGGQEGIVESGFARLLQSTQLPAMDLARGLVAWLGPCIGPQAFEVGAEVRQAFSDGQPEAQACFVLQGSGKYLADLPALARLRLRRLGIRRVFGNDGSAAWCTVAQSRFFSHRRINGRIGGRLGDTGGRMAACIWLT